MARNDGVDRTSVRNLAVSDKAVGNTQQHNEREKDSYRNPDIIPQRTSWNVHFKKPTASYTDLFAQLEAAGTISTRGLKPDATHYCELIFDVNSAYFDNMAATSSPSSSMRMPTKLLCKSWVMSSIFSRLSCTPMRSTSP